MTLWCNKIERINGRDRFKVSNKTVLCHKHFLPENSTRAPGSSKVNKVKAAVPVLFPWNNRSFEKAKRAFIIRKVTTPSADPTFKGLENKQRKKVCARRHKAASQEAYLSGRKNGRKVRMLNRRNYKKERTKGEKRRNKQGNKEK